MIFCVNKFFVIFVVSFFVVFCFVRRRDERRRQRRGTTDEGRQMRDDNEPKNNLFKSAKLHGSQVRKRQPASHVPQRYDLHLVFLVLPHSEIHKLHAGAFGLRRRVSSLRTQHDLLLIVPRHLQRRRHKRSRRRQVDKPAEQWLTPVPRFVSEFRPSRSVRLAPLAVTP